MPIDLLQYLEEQDVLAVGRLKLNYNFETLVDFVNYLEGENHAERNSTIDIVQGLHGFSIGDAIRFDSVSGLFVKSRADTPENSEVFGIVSGYEDVSRFTVTLTGLLHDLGFNLTVGAVYYLQDDGSVGTSPGTISRTLYGVIPPAEDGEPNRGVVLNESSISSIEALRDVDLTGLADNDVLVYSADDQTWVAKALDFDSLVGIDGTPNNGDILIYNASDGLWKPEPPVGGGDMYTAIYDPQRIGVVETARHALEVDWTNVSNKDLTQHTHPILQVVGLSGELANKAQRVHRHDNASQTEDGFLSKEDKVKLDGDYYARTDGENTLTGVQTIQGQLRVSNGSDSAPSVVFDSDRDTGIYRVTGNEFAVATGGARRMSINATRAYFDGNVEINGTYTRSATPSTGDDLDLINRGWFNNNYLQDGDVTVNKLGNLAVTTAKLGNLAVTEGKIGTWAVGIDKIANGAVVTDKIASYAVTNLKLGDGAVNARVLATNAVITDKISNGAVTDAKLSGTLSPSRIGNGAITPAKTSFLHGITDVYGATVNSDGVAVTPLPSGWTVHEEDSGSYYISHDIGHARYMVYVEGTSPITTANAFGRTPSSFGIVTTIQTTSGSDFEWLKSEAFPNGYWSSVSKPTRTSQGFRFVVFVYP